MTSYLPHWFLLGAGNMGTLAAWYLTRAGHGITVVRSGASSDLKKQLHRAGNPELALQLPTLAPEAITGPVRHLLVAVKTPYTRSSLSPLLPWINEETQVLRLQNGLGALDGLLPSGQVVEAVSTSAVKGQHPDHEIIAENTTWMGGNGPQPDWFVSLTPHWPDLQWCDDIREPQWKKLVANAVINPLTALHDVPNGHIVSDPALRDAATRLCQEADRVLQALNPDWPGHSLDNVLAVAQATAGNTSSMRADRQRGAPTEIEAINGWLVTQANRLGIAVPAHLAIIASLTRGQ